MAATVFDTLAAARKLKAAGVEAAQAEAHAETIADAIAGGGLAAKTDIARLEGTDRRREVHPVARLPRRPRPAVRRR